MKIRVNGCRLFVDVVGAHLVADGPIMRERPQVFMLHGGPGFDHTSLKPDLNSLADVAQLIYYDHRGQGRSDASGPEHWNLNQWADDLYELTHILGVDNPVVFGLSFGGFVAQNYAIRHPDRLQKLILASTVARMVRSRVYEAFERFGGEGARSAAETFWEAPSPEALNKYIKTCMPLYTRNPRDPDASSRSILSPAVIENFAAPGGENWTFDFREGLRGVTCPTLITGGEIDPVTPIEAITEMANCIPRQWRSFHIYPDCGHGVHRDTDAVFEVMRQFLAN